MKRSNHVHWTLIGALALVGCAIPAQAAFVSINTCNPAVAAPAGSLISLPGDYQVTADLSQTGATDCILITASGVSLKVNGHQISNATSGGNGINVSGAGRLDHVAIQGPGLVRGFNNGVRFANADYSQVGNLTTSSNQTNGITGNGVTFLTIGSNVMTVNGIWGLLLVNAINSVVQYNDMSGNGTGTPTIAGGMRIASGTANTVNNNLANGNGAQSSPFPTFNGGILIGANGNRLYSNTTNGSHGPGIEVSGSGNQLFHNTSVTGGLATFDLLDDNANCDSNSWSDNTFLIASSTCIR
jgi:parallel beta-helix repeat protein